MYDFLTEKSRGRRGYDIPVLVVCGILLAAGISVLADDIREGDPDLWASVVLDALIALPIVRILLRWRRASIARTIARGLVNEKREEVPVDELASVTKVSDLSRKLHWMIEKGYLKDLKYDLRSSSLLLPKKAQPAAEAVYVAVECPNCGATNSIARGSSGKCAYCGSILNA